jgi:hypothetical protein
MIGYYVHHQGRGHLSRAMAIARALPEPVTVLSTLEPSPQWSGPWVELPGDTDDPAPSDPDAGGRLHWAPLRSAGLRRRMTAIASWIGSAQPSAMVVDVSVEVAVLCRLLGAPVVTIAMPGARRDAAHALGFGVSTAIVAAWPEGAAALDAGLPEDVRGRVRRVGPISRFTTPPDESEVSRRTVLVLSGGGGDDFTPELVDAARRSTPGWSWSHIGGRSGWWSDDPWSLIRSAEVIVTHAGENAIAEVSAARRPAVVIPQRRPHEEQAATARALLAGRCPVTVLRRFPVEDWAGILERTAGKDGGDWLGWNDGEGARRAAAIIRDVAAGSSRL